MKRKILTIIVMMLMTSSSITMFVSAGSEEDPELQDNEGDTTLLMYDILQAWFYEIPEEPNYLFTVLKINDLSGRSNAVYSIKWNYNEINYVCGLDTFYYKENIFRSGNPQRATYWQWNSMPECEGEFNLEESIITWKIPKNEIGSPPQGAVLQQIRAHAVPGFPMSFIYFFTGRDYRDFMPDSVGEYGRDYVIQY
jgi:hypothetical protein